VRDVRDDVRVPEIGERTSRANRSAISRSHADAILSATVT